MFESTKLRSIEKEKIIEKYSKIEQENEQKIGKTKLFHVSDSSQMDSISQFMLNVHSSLEILNSAAWTIQLKLKNIDSNIEPELKNYYLNQLIESSDRLKPIEKGI